jgi:predicted homoserine dehydrogenase-like protein
MFGYSDDLRALERPVRVGVIGAGQFGTKCVDHLERVPNLRASAVADPVTERAAAAYSEAGVPGDERQTVDGPEETIETIAAGQRAVVSDGRVLIRADLDVVVEATGEPVAGARHAFEAITSGTHVVMATVEADVTIGPLLADLAVSMGVVYSLAYGDQPALVAELVDWARTAGFDVVAAGRGTHAYRTNTAVELGSASNATGLPPDTTGLHAPTIPLKEIPDVFRPETMGGILSTTGVVEGTVSPPDEPAVPGQSIADSVFVVVTTPNDDALAFVRKKNRLGAYFTEDGGHAVFFRPHHLPGVETPVSVARAALDRGPTGTPRGHVADVVARAEKQIPAGATIEISYPDTDAPLKANLESANRARMGGHVPLALLDGADVVDTLDTEETITYDDIDLEPTFLRHLRAVMDARSEP